MQDPFQAHSFNEVLDYHWHVLVGKPVISLAIWPPAMSPVSLRSDMHVQKFSEVLRRKEFYTASRVCSKNVFLVLATIRRFRCKQSLAQRTLLGFQR